MSKSSTGAGSSSVGPPQPTVGMAIEEAAATPGKTTALGKCMFDCGPPRPYSQLTNTATHVYPRWMCNPCNNARKALESYARKKDNSEILKAINHLKKTDLEQWKSMVRASRIRSADDPPAMPGVLDLTARNAMILTTTKTVTQESRLSEKATLAWMDKDSYAAYLKNVRGRSGIDLEDDTSKAAILKEAMDNPNVQRRFVGNAPQILVDKGEDIEGSRSRIFSMTVSKTTAIGTPAEVTAALEEMAGQGASRAPFVGDSWGSAGQTFNLAHVADPQSSFDDPIFGHTPTKGSAPPREALLLDSEWTPYGTGSSGSGTRVLQGHPSAVSEPSRNRQAKKPRSALTLGNRLGISGGVLDAHIQAKAIWGKLKADYGTSKTNPEKMLGQLVKDHPEMKNSEDYNRMDTFVKEFADIHDPLKDIALKDSQNWTIEDCEANLVKLKDNQEQLQDIWERFSAILEEVREQFRAAKRRRKSDTMHAARTGERIARPYIQANTPGNLARWLVTQKAFGMISQTQTETGEVEEEEDSQVGQPQQTVAVEQNASFRHNWAMDSSAEIAVDTPSVYSSEHPGVGASLKKLHLAMDKRVSDSIQDRKLQNLIDQESKFAAAAGQPRSGVSHLRMAAKGGHQDSLEQAAWTPQAWRSMEIVPEALRDEGAPWLLCGSPGSTRYKNSSWPLPGHGQILSVIQGTVILVTIPYKTICSRGASEETAVEWFFRDVAYNIFEKMVNKDLKAITLSKGCTAWVPFGWATILVSMGWTAEHSYVLSAPFVNSKLAMGYPGIEKLSTFWEAIVSKRTSSSWASWKPAYLQYFGSLREVYKAQQAPANQPLPIADTSADPMAKSENANLEKTLADIIDSAKAYKASQEGASRASQDPENSENQDEKVAASEDLQE